MASPTLSKYNAVISRLKSQVSAIRSQARAHAQRAAAITTTTALTVGGGALSGVARAKYPTIGGYPTDALVGALLCGAALMDMAGDYSDELNSLGAGLLAGFLSREVEAAVLRAG